MTCNTEVKHPVMYVPPTNMPLRCHIFKLLRCRYETSRSVYMPHINSLQSTMRLEVLVYILFKFVPYVSEQICLPHGTYMSHYTTTLVPI